MKKYEHLLYSAIGLVALFLALIAFNYLASTAPVRADLTDGKLYTLSDGTKKILQRLDAPVKLRLYLSQGESVPVQLRGYAQRVEDLVREFKSVAGSNLVIDSEGNFLGSVSGGCVEGAVVTEAIDVIESGKSKMLEFGVADETAWNVGLSCGGTIRVYVEKVG